jgi:hypothetical protein
MPVQPKRCALLIGLLLEAGTGLTSGCGSSSGLETLSPNQSATQSVTWIGIDQRPLAVGTQLTLAYQLPPGKTSASEAVTVNSSDPGIVALSSLDLTHNRMLVTALAPGQAAIALQGRDVHGDLPVTAAKAATIAFFDENYLAAGMGVPLPKTGFGLLAGGQEIIGAVIKDSAKEQLNSRGLAFGEGHEALSVTKEEPEMFVLSSYPAAGASMASMGTFCGGLTAAPCSENSYPVTLVNVIANVVIAAYPASDNVSKVAVAQAVDANQNPIFGVSDWEFQLSAGTFTRLAPAAVQVQAPVPTTGPITLTATAVNEGVSGSINLF